MLGYPVIDADGHLIELVPAALPYLRESLGAKAFDRYRDATAALTSRLGSGGDERWATRTPQGGWWSSAVNNSRDLAAFVAPKLLHERLPEVGIDYSVLYPTLALAAAGIEDDELRVGLCRGWNDYFAHIYGPYADRMTVAGLIPMNTPEEAIAELDHCKAIGIKVVSIPHMVLRSIEKATPSPWRYPGQTHWCDFFTLDSAYNYDPVWERFRQHGYAVTIHVGVGAAPLGWYHWVSNFVANHVGSFSSACQPVCKAFLLGGFTKRFPDLPVAFQECGASWAVTLLSDVIEHWEKRNTATMRKVFDPALYDAAAYRHWLETYGHDQLAAIDGDIDAALRATLLIGSPPPNLDEFAAIDVASEDDLIDRFVPHFWFGCEADDRTVMTAFANHNGIGRDLKVMLGSDIGHFDTPAMDDVVPHARSLVERGLLDEQQLQALLFTNAHELFTAANQRFFEGTAISGQST